MLEGLGWVAEGVDDAVAGDPVMAGGCETLLSDCWVRVASE